MKKLQNKKILYFVNVDWFFVSHRLDIAIEALNKDYEVHIATNFTNHRDRLENLGIKTHSIDIERSNTSLISALKGVYKFNKILKKINPSIVHSITLKISLIALLSSLFNRSQKYIFAISGLGRIFTVTSIKNWFIKGSLKLSFFFVAAGKYKLIFQNQNDHDDFIGKNRSMRKHAVIFNGSGVDLDYFIPDTKKYPDGTKQILFASRLLITKGILDFLKAVIIFNERRPHLVNKIFFTVAGKIDKDNPDSLNQDVIEKYNDIKNLSFIGHVDDIKGLLQNSYSLILPSYREGLPLINCQAAACGIPIITTDVPGCRDSIINNETGILIPVQDPDSICRAIIKIIESPDKYSSMSLKARTFAEKKFDKKVIKLKHLNLYEELLNF